jgi:hypothetical protein
MAPKAQMLDSDEYWALLGPTSVERPAVVTDGQGILLRTGRGGQAAGHRGKRDGCLVTGKRFTLSAAGTWPTPLDETTRAGLT